MNSDTPSDHLSLTAPTLPKSGGAFQGLPSAPGTTGVDGQASLTIALPISPGRGYAPRLELHYLSGAGNGPWGAGWRCMPPFIRRSTRHGVPAYDDHDSFQADDGEVLVPERDAQGRIVSTPCSRFGGQPLDRTYQVTRYWPRVLSDFTRVERWRAQGTADFWLMHYPDGELLCLGKTAQARVADPGAPETRIASWLAEESVSPTGEHIYYQYSSAAQVGVHDPNGRDIQSQRLLSRVCYGNLNAAAGLWSWSTATPPAEQAWLFTLILDYGALGTDSNLVPDFPEKTPTPWPTRQDAFSEYDAGFEIRTHFLCRQALMFHHFPKELGQKATLVRRLLLGYDENPTLSLLSCAQNMAYEADAAHTLQCLPPLELEYSSFTPPVTAEAWQPLTIPVNAGGSSFDFVDLYGEGMPGLLYRNNGAWYYCAPERDNSSKASPDAVTYGPASALPLLPALQAERSIHLLDLNGDGRLEWLVTRADGLAGYYTLNADRHWSAFTPLTALPTAYLHSDIRFVDLHRAGLPDLATIGPRSVRLYVNQRSGFGPGHDEPYAGERALPVPGRRHTELVAFADLLGSGQAHLVSVRHDRIQCWPSLGDGRFGEPLTLSGQLPFDPMGFDPRHVYLVDLDGSGAADLLYAEAHGIQVFLNQAGNRFAPPVTLPYPEGVTHDRLVHLRIVDLDGQGTPSLVLTQLAAGPERQPCHWRYDLSASKPYLLHNVTDHCGSSSTLTYRSSAQEWLDEKKPAPDTSAGLPFALNVVKRIEQSDACTGSCLEQTFLYRRGDWDSVEREFRGFGYIESQTWVSTTDKRPPALLRTCRWYHTGRGPNDSSLYGMPYRDPLDFTLQATRLTQWQGSDDDGQDHPITPDAGTAWWLYRSLKGTVLREERYGPDDSSAVAIPYSVMQTRAQVRLVQPGTAPVVQPLTAETLSYRYERVAEDPQIQQHITLHYDRYGQALWSVALVYPRRLQANSANPYKISALPDEAWPATFDPQQTLLRLNETRRQLRNQANPQAWRLGVALITRHNVLTYAAEQMPAKGLCLEALLDPNGLLGAAHPRTLLNQQRWHYRDDATQPDTLVLLDHIETALLLDSDLQAYDGALSTQQQQQMLSATGYLRMPALLTVPGATPEPDLWAANTGYMDYLPAERFWRAYSETEAKTPAADGKLPILSVQWDPYLCCITRSQDGYGNTVSADIDYRFLAPWRIVDSNENSEEIQTDALARSVATSRYGTELAPDQHSAIQVGFVSVKTQPAPLHDSVSQGIAQALAINQGSGKQAYASRTLYNAFSAMGQLTLALLRPLVSDEQQAEALFKHLAALGFITPQGHVLNRAWHWVDSGEPRTDIPSALRERLQTLPRQPAHYVTLSADAYPQGQQQIQVNVVHYDSTGRVLQNATLRPPGPAFQRTAAGEFVTKDGHPQEATSDPRWAISARVEHRPDGVPLRVYQPYWLNDWQFVTTAALRTYGYGDLHTYDALGRPTQVNTAKGWVRRQQYTPWFTVDEDENDTAAETLLPGVEKQNA